MKTILESKEAMLHFKSRLGDTRENAENAVLVLGDYEPLQEYPRKGMDSNGYMTIRNVWIVRDRNSTEPHGHITLAECRMLVEDGILDRLTHEEVDPRVWSWAQFSKAPPLKVSDRGVLLMFTDALRMLREL